jgi:hypothetical protein
MGNSSLPECEAASAWAKGCSGKGTCTKGKGTSLSMPRSEEPDTQGIVGLGSSWRESKGGLAATERTGMQSIHAVHGSRVLRTRVSTGLGGGQAGSVLLRLLRVSFLQTHRTSQKHSMQVHSTLATLRITARQAMHGGHQQTRQRTQGILHNMFISGHAQASPEAASARLSKHAYRGTIQQEVPPNQSHAELPQSTSHKRGLRDTARARGLIP